MISADPGRAGSRRVARLGNFRVIGLFIGIDLIFYGAAWIALALGLRSA